MSTKQIPFEQGYDLWCESYDAFDNPLIQMADLAVGSSDIDFTGRTVLDLGCGTGRNCALALEKGARLVTGMDGSAGMLARAHKRLEERAESLKLIAADLLAPLPLTNDTFDIIIISLVLEHVADLLPLFIECHRVLAPGGRIYIAEMHPVLRAGGTAAHFKLGGTQYSLPSYPHTEDDLQTSMVAAGISITTTTSFFASESFIRAIPKLHKHRGSPVLISILGEKAC